MTRLFPPPFQGRAVEFATFRSISVMAGLVPAIHAVERTPSTDP